MNILENFYNYTPQNDIFFPRKLSLPKQGSFILSGARGVGKSALILDWLANKNNNKLYIDAQDPIFALEDIDIISLNSFIKSEEIETVVIDHWYDDFLEKLPSVENLVLISRRFNNDFNMNQFYLSPLDYEEFINFDRSHSQTVSFNKFLKIGSLPSVSRVNSKASILKLREFFYEKFTEDESRLLLILAHFQGRRVTTHQIYSYAKEYFKISKDWIYKTIKSFIEEGIIIKIENYQKASGEKIYLYDFVLSRYLHKEQSFLITFDSMVISALIKHQFPFKAFQNMGYILDDGYLVIPAPFESEDIFWKKAQINYNKFKKLNIEKISIVTVSSRYSFRIENLEFEAMPFYEWSILNE